MLHARQHLEVTLAVPTTVHVLLPTLSVHAETPEMGQADQLLAVDCPLMGQVRPLVRASGLRHTRHP